MQSIHRTQPHRASQTGDSPSRAFASDNSATEFPFVMVRSMSNRLGCSKFTANAG